MRLLVKDPIYRKPQVEARLRLKGKASRLMAEWFQGYQIPVCRSVILAEAVVQEAVDRFIESMDKTASDISLADAQVLESMLFSACSIAAQWDLQGKLDAVLIEAQAREDAKKHGLGP